MRCIGGVGLLLDSQGLLKSSESVLEHSVELAIKYFVKRCGGLCLCIPRDVEDVISCTKQENRSPIPRTQVN